jgi:hypothetical protein
MIKKTLLILFLAFMFMSLSKDCFADEGDLSLGGIFGGAGLRGMSDCGSNGFGFGGFLSYAPSDVFDLDLNFVYAPHSNGANKANSFYGTIALKGGMTYDQLLPFITAGVGVYRNSVTRAGLSNSAASFGFNFGGGMDVDLGKWFRMGLLARYHSVLGKDAAGGRGVDDMWDVLLRVGFLFRTGVQGGWD